MLRWFSSIIIITVSFFSCAFADLTPIGITISPSESGEVLSGEYSPVIAAFDTPMEKSVTEGILQISSDSGSVGGDYVWKENELHFIPVQGWTAGVRYTMSLSGMARAADGRELRLERFISFYAISTSPAPLVTAYSPADGSSTGTGDTVLELRFSRPMERISTENAFILEGSSGRQFEWLDDDQTLKVRPEKALNAWSSYHWSLKNTAKSRDGVPLAKAFQARFSTDKDETLPKVSSVYPAINSNGRWFPTGGCIERDFGPGQAIVIEFNKATGSGILRSLRFDPSLAGTTEQLSANSIIFIPTRNPEPETEYTLIVSADSRDDEGLKTGEDYKVSFIPDIPWLEILSISADGGSVLHITDVKGDLGSRFKVPVEPTKGELTLTICFSFAISDEEKQNAAMRISLTPFFPRTLEPVALRSVSWVSNDRIRMTWEWLSASVNGETHYYKLFFPGDKGGITTGEGMYFKEDKFLYLEAVQ